MMKTSRGSVEDCDLPYDNPFIALARSWERESRELRLDPNAPTPPDIAKRRFAELQAMLAWVSKP